MDRDNSIKNKKKQIAKANIEECFPDYVLPLIELQIFNKGEYLYHCGERVEYFHIIMEGKCKVVPLSESGKEILLSYLEPLSFSGDIELFNECEALHSVCVVTKVVAIAISRKVFFNEMMNIPTFLQLLCKNLAAKIYLSSQQRSTNMLYSVRTQLSHILIAAAEEKDTNDIQISMGELAQLLGISQRHLRRILCSFEDEGALCRERGKIVILDKEILKEQAAAI